MRLVGMRSTIYGIGALGALAITVAACGGGGGTSTAPSVAPSSALPTTISPSDGYTNYSGPSAPVTVSVTIPRGTGVQNSANVGRLVKIFGTRSKNALIRTMANTSPSASVRAAGARVRAYVAQFETKSIASTGSRREPQYVGNQTSYMEFVVMNSSNTIMLDQAIGCEVTANQCTGTFNAPVGTGFTVALFLYDNCGPYLLSAGALTNQTIAGGTTNNISLTLNGVVAGFVLTTNPASDNYGGYSVQNSNLFSVNELELYQGFTQSFTVTPQAWDADGNQLTTPGVLMDATFTQIASVNVQPTNAPVGISPTASQNLPIPASGNLAPGATGTYTWDGTGTETSIGFTVTNNYTGSPLIPSAITSSTCAPSTCNSAQNSIGSLYAANNALTLTVEPPGLAWTNTYGNISNYINQSSNPAGVFSGSGPNYALEIGTPPEAGPTPSAATYNLTLTENLPYASNTISFSDNAQSGGPCVGTILNSLPGSFTPVWPYASAQTNNSVTSIPLQIIASSNGSCEIEAEDTPGNITYLTINVNNPSITIQQRNRK